MIKKLRIRFVMTAFLSVLAVLITLVGGMNVSNYLHVIRDSDKILKMLSDNGGSFPERDLFGNGGRFEGMPPQGGRGERIDSPELAFETRFFSVTYAVGGDAVRTDTEKVYAVTEETAVLMADRALAENSREGFIGDYRYMISDGADGERLVIFCDRGAALSNFRSFRNTSIVISLFGLLILGTVIYLISGRAVRPIEEANEKQKRFVSDAGHEIKTPLAIIRADADVLGMDIGEDNEWVSDIIKQTERLSQLTGDLITLSKMEEAGPSLVMEETDISALAEDVADSVKAPAKMQKKNFSAEIEPGVHIRCDKKSVYELMNILLDNAVKYCPEGKDISFSLSSKGKKACISVTNDTEGTMDAETAERLFDRFYRGDSSRNSQTGGFGIGLSVAYAIVSAHKGQIKAGIPAKEKITFTVIL